MALLQPNGPVGSLDLALLHCRQPIQNMFAVQVFKLWSREPDT
jgi:hypothetical protein